MIRSTICLLALAAALPAAAQSADRSAAPPDDDRTAEASVLARIGRTPEAPRPVPAASADDVPDDQAEARLLERVHGHRMNPPGTPVALPAPGPLTSDETPDDEVPARVEEALRSRQREAADDLRGSAPPDARPGIRPDGGDASLAPAGGTVRFLAGIATVRSAARLRTSQNVLVAPGATLAGETGAWLDFTGGDDQTLDTDAPLTFPSLALAKTGGTVTLLDDVTVGITLDLADDVLRTAADLTLAGSPLGTGTLGVTGTGTQTLSAPGPLTLAGLHLDQIAGTLALPVPVTVTGTMRNLGSTFVGGSVAVGPDGTLDLAGGTLTLGADLPVYGVVVGNGGDHARNGFRLVLAATVNGSTVERLAALDGDGWTIGAASGDRPRYDRPQLDGEGWRMIASPFDGLPFTQLNDDFPTQGAANTDIPSGPPILYQWVPANPPGSRYVAVPDFTNTITSGRGFLFYAYATDPLSGLPALPATWDLIGHEPSGTVQASLSYDPGDAQRRWNLLGNPYAAPIDWHLVQAGGQFEDTYAVWDPAATAYAYYSTTGIAIGRAGRYVPAFQGFWARSTGSSPFTLSFQRAWKAPTEDGVHVGRTSGAVPPHVRLRLTGADLPAAEAVAILSDDPLANGAWLAPLAPDHASLFFADDAPGDAPGDATGERLVFAARPPGAPAAFALGAEATRAGTFTLSWPDLASAPDGALVLTDTQTGARVDLRQAPSYTFTLDAPSAANAAVRAGLPSSPGDVAGASRFVLTVGGSVVVSTEGEPVPSSLVVEAPRPNPATASVSVRVGLPVAGRLEVRLYDALGRWVSTVSEGDRGAGWHEVRAEVGSLPSGVYVMRVAAAGATSVRRLTVLR